MLEGIGTTRCRNYFTLLKVRKKPEMWTLSFHNIPCSQNIIRFPKQTPIVHIPVVQGQIRNFIHQFVDKYLKHQTKQKRAQRVALLNSCLRKDNMIPKKLVTMLRVTKMDPFENLREALVTFFEKDISLN